jgi:hypothetical protein
LLSAQITADVTGIVLDQAGASVPNSKVTITSQETGERRVAAVDTQGRFAANQLKIGLYAVQAEAPGFRPVRTETTLRSGETSSVQFKLEVGQVRESVTVSDVVSPLDSSDSQIQLSLDSARVQDLPVARNPILFALTVPGVVPVTANNPFLNAGGYNSHGGRGRGNNITVDSITASDISSTGNAGSQLGPLNFSVIKEVKVITNNFNAEYGRNANSQLQFITKSGTNEYHGEAYEYLQNSQLNARDWFDRTGAPAVVRYNEFGGVIGGPVIRNRTHFLASYQGIQLRGAGAARIAQVPTPAMLAQVSDPTSKKILDLYKLPAATSVLSSFGQVQQSANRYTKAPLALSFRVDHQFSANDSITGRYSQYGHEQGSTGNTFVATNLAGYGATTTNRPRQANLAETHLFSATLVNEFRAGFGRSSPIFSSQSPVDGPRIQFTNGQVDRFGQSEIFPQGRTQNTFQYTDTVTWSRGAHNLKFGADVYRYQLNSFFDNLTRGLYTFADWNGFAAGAPTNDSQNFGTSLRGNRVTMHDYFVQDDWKASRNLTLNIGLRTEVSTGTSEVNGLISNLDPGCTDPIGAAGAGPFGCITIGRPSNHTHVSWGPRFGFAWSPGSSRKTVVRGGYGIAYDFLFLNPIVNQRFLPPYVTSSTLSGAARFSGGNTFANLISGTATAQQQASGQVGRLSATALNFGNFNPAIDPNLRPPMVQQWSFGLQRELARDLVVKATYVGSKGDHLQESRPVNLIVDPRLVPAASVADETARLASFQAVNSGQNGGLNSRSNRLDPRFNNVTVLESSAASNYHAIELLALKSFARSYFLQAGYTYGKSIDNGSDALGVLINDNPLAQDPRNMRAERAPSQFDQRQRLVVTHTWEPNWGAGISKAWLRRLARGWGFSGISSFRSGFPLTFDGAGRRGITPLSLTGSGTGQPVRPNAAGPVAFDPQPAGSPGAPSGLTTDIQPISAYAASLGLTQPLLGNFGTLGRNTNRLAGERNFDWNIYKNTAITERVKLQLRCEMYNVFNGHAFQDVNRNITSPAFGQYTTVSTNARSMQLGARIVF